MRYLLKILQMFILGKMKYKKLQNQLFKQLIISKNNFKLSKQYSLTNRAKKILEEIKK